MDFYNKSYILYLSTFLLRKNNSQLFEFLDEIVVNNIYFFVKN